MHNKAFLVLAIVFCAIRHHEGASVNRNNIVTMGIESASAKVKSNQHELQTDSDIHSLWQKAIASTKQNKCGRPVTEASDLLDHEIAEKHCEFEVRVDLDKAISTTGPKFVGVTLDSCIFRHAWKHFNVASKALHSLAKGLSPSYVRVGGTAADFFIFSETADDGSNENDAKTESTDEDYEDYPNYDYDKYNLNKPRIKNFTVTGPEWERLNYLVQVAGWDLVFDFNEFLRQNGGWDTDNARTLLMFSQERKYRIPYFQLGNEPNSYYYNFHFRISASQLAKDMMRLRSLLSEFPAYHNSNIVGPDVTKVTRKSAEEYYKEFLADEDKTIAAATLHHYYFNARSHSANMSDFINTTILNSLKEELSIGTSVAHRLSPTLPVWLSETSSVSGGGLPRVSDAFVAGFMWLDKLGLSALYGLQAVLRQSFYHGNYPLVSEDFTPYPDYFLTLLYKRLVQGPVFHVSSSTDAVRVYASCSNPSFYPRGSLTVYVLNVKDTATILNFTQFTDHSYDLYILTPGDQAGLRSMYVALNGQKLVMVNEELPTLSPKKHAGPVVFPSYSFGFVVIPEAEVKVCKAFF